MPHSFPSEYHYIRLAISPSNSDALVLRKTLQDSLTQTFGITASSTYIDILWVANGGEEFVVRVGNGSVLFLAQQHVWMLICGYLVHYIGSDAAKILAAIVAWSDSPKMTMIKESPFLPSLLSTDTF
jgi:hypothetical protein